MERVVTVTELSDAANVMILTDAGRIYVSTKKDNWWGTVWREVLLPENIGVGEVAAAEKVEDLGRMPQDYTLYKRNDTGLFYWEKLSPVQGVDALTGLTPEQTVEATSEQFDRMEGAIAAARNDYMIRNRPPPAPRPGKKPV